MPRYVISEYMLHFLRIRVKGCSMSFVGFVGDMGKGVSKLHASPLVSLCRERKQFIKAAKYCRYDLVTAFVMYLQSLLELGNALNQYVEQELVIFGDSFPEVSFSDSDIFYSSDLEFPTSDSDSDLDSLFHHVHGDVQVPRGLHDSPELVPDKSKTCTTENQQHSADINHMKSTGKPRVERTSQGPESSNLSSNDPHHSNQKNTHIHMAMSREDLGNHEYKYKYNNQEMSFGSRWETPQGGHWFPQHVNQDSFGAPMSFSYYNDRFVHYGAETFPMDVPPNHGTEQNNPATALPTPPPPQVSTWDFLYPFSMNYDVHYDVDHDVREVREREGIPDLEDETEQSSTVSVFDEKATECGMRHGSSGNNDTSNVTQLNSSKDALSAEGKELTILGKTTQKKIKRNSKTFVSKNSEPKTGEGVWSETEETTVHGNKSLGTSSVTTPGASCRMGLKEAVLDIRNEFKYVFDCGTEFLSVIEVGKLPHHPISTKLRGRISDLAFSYCVLGLTIPSVQTCFCPSNMLYQPASRARLLSNADMRNNQEHVCTTFGDLSSTLEQLYVWENKLYGEVRGEEKLRIPYDKQCKKLKKLDVRGAESDKIDDTLACIKLLDSEINVAVASISGISREIDELRDKKLLPELNKLFEGLIRLWKVMSTCHQKQFQAIAKAKSHVHILDPGKRKKSSSIATLSLERVVLNWGMCFSNFINTQKSFVKHLNDWLLRYILQEPEETEDGIGPLSPSDIGAPPIFRVCNDWYHAIDKISEIEVSKAISNFASSLHQLYEKQEEEHALKVRVKYLLKDYQHRLKSFCKKNGINSHNYFSFINMKASGDFLEAGVPLLSRPDENLATSRKRLVEQRERHQEVIRHVNDAASSCLQVDLSPIFEALGSFCLENLKIYEQLRLPNAGPHE